MYRYSGKTLTKLEFFRHIFDKHSHIKFHENPSSERRAVPCGRTDIHVDRQTDMTKLIVAFRNFAKALKIHHIPKNFGGGGFNKRTRPVGRGREEVR